MFAYIKGTLIEKSPTEAVVEAGGVGYLINISLKTFENLPEAENVVKLHTIHVVREDAQNLFGFAAKSEKDAFQLLTSVSGIGGKTALGILSSANPGNLAHFIMENNLHALQKLPGIGKKTAERLLLELKEKIHILMTSENDSIDQDYHIKMEAVSALVALGFQRAASEKSVNLALEMLPKGKILSEDLIKTALKIATT